MSLKAFRFSPKKGFVPIAIGKHNSGFIVIPGKNQFFVYHSAKKKSAYRQISMVGALKSNNKSGLEEVFKQLEKEKKKKRKKKKSLLKAPKKTKFLHSMTWPFWHVITIP